MAIRPGLHETLVTGDVSDALDALDAGLVELDALGESESPELLAEHLGQLVFKVLRSLKVDGQRVGSVADRLRAKRVAFANDLVAWLSARESEERVDAGEQVPQPGRVLRLLRDPADVRLGDANLPRPQLSIRHSDLMVNGPRDVRLGHLIQGELPSADRVDILISFFKYSGLRVVLDALRVFAERRPGALRVLTTTYMGATEVRALETLRELGADVRVSYDSRRTRLHAKAWMFHRESGFSTGLVGSSNLSRAALLDGCEWNVRVSQVDNGVVFRKLTATFEQYWSEESFEPYDRDRFEDVLDAGRAPDAERCALARAVQVTPYPHQREVLDSLVAERGRGYRRNLVVAATGTGKTVVAALDYARIRKQLGSASLLFVAHREEILQQSLATFRAVLRDGGFGRLLSSGRRLDRDLHVFASIQSLHAERLAKLRPDAYDVVIVDEFPHAAAKSYQALLEHLRPKYLLGLTATPERADGRSVLGYFEERVAAEIRLWDALDLGLLSPFQYFGVHDGTDLSRVDFVAGRYDIETLTKLYTADHVRARGVLRATREKVRDVLRMRALGFCVSVKHAEFMARFFSEQGVPALAVSGGTKKPARARALAALRSGEVKVLFSVDLFNEGVDLPNVDTVLFLRPTESPTIFLQQLGRGLRIAEGKECLTVLDFIGNAHRKFRFDRRYGALIRGTRAEVGRAVEQGFPQLPAGCEIQLDHEARAAVLRNIRAAMRLGKRALAQDLAKVGDVGLREFLVKADVQLEDVYSGGGSYTELLHRSGLRAGSAPNSTAMKALQRLQHVDDAERLSRWREWLEADEPLVANPADSLQLMLFASLGHVRRPAAQMQQAWDELWAELDLRRELCELFALLEDRRRQPTFPLQGVPFHVHASYSRDEVTAGLGELRKGKLLRLQGGVFKHEPTRTDYLFVTLEKDEKHFTPTTLYEDYAMSEDRFHWESQGVTRADSPTGRRYQDHVAMEWRICLFVRRRRQERGVTSAFHFLGPVRYESHEREKPMRIIWRLERPMPPAFWNEVKVAAG
jgi:superfamily II DNA or RNA helicase